jgi:hypothetical protein
MSRWAVAPGGCTLGVKELALKGTCATKLTDTMEGNSRRLYQGGYEPLRCSGWWMQASGEIATSKRYRCGARQAAKMPGLAQRWHGN